MRIPWSEPMHITNPNVPYPWCYSPAYEGGRLFVGTVILLGRLVEVYAEEVKL